MNIFLMSKKFMFTTITFGLEYIFIIFNFQTVNVMKLDAMTL